MRSYCDTKPQRTVSEGNILLLEQNDFPKNSLSSSQGYKEVSKSCQSMSTSVSEFDSGDNDGNRTNHSRKPSIRGVKKLMNRIVGSNKGKRGKQTENEGLVKGGLTPTLRRRENGAETRRTIDGNYNNGSDDKNHSTNDDTVDSASRPLMTRSNLQVALPKWDKTPGALGIYNHGNTCFMNTVLQCLSNTDGCAEYFVLKHFKELLNVKGIAKRLVGTFKGDITEHLSQLLESLWSLNYSPSLSDHFKSVVSKYNVQYKGSSQHDAQEFLLWLLDRLNEELQHSQKKKSKDTLKLKKQNELPAESSPEAVLSMAQGFEIYNKFQALYQSSLICPNCGKQSDTYESYLCLSLPVPQRCLRPVYITVVYLDDDPKQLRIALEMNMFEMVKDLREKLAFELDVTPKRLVICQVGDTGFRNTFGDEQPLSDIHENENVYAFETFPLSEVSTVGSSYETIQILLVNIERYSSTKRICSPQVIRVPRDVDYKYIQKQILKSLGLAVPDDVIIRADEYPVLFKIHVVDSGAKDCYLPTDVEMPLYTEAIDRALNTYNEGFGPKHVKFIVEWDPRIKERIIVNDDEQLEEHHSVHKVRLNQQQPSHVSLDECLKLFTKEERLSDEDAWSCPFCKKEQRGATKKLGLWSCPDILVIHLKRFRQTGLRRNKLNILVNFPVTGLDMGRHILQKEGSSTNGPTSQGEADMYDLYGVTNHYGNMSGGHYTAFCKNPIDFHWYEFDDTHVKPITSRDIVSRAAYLLFYQKRQLTEASRTALQNGTHWIFTLYERPSVDNTSVEDRTERTDRDFVDSADGRIRNNKSESSLRSLNLNGKSKSVERDNYSNREQEYNELHREINSPRQSVESRSGNNKAIHQVINSPRQERSYRSSPEKETRSDRHTSDDLSAKSINNETLWVNMDKTKSSATQNVVENGLDFREKYYVERINIPRSEVNINGQQTYRRSFSEDSYKNAVNNSFTSSIEDGPRYNPLSPSEVVKSNPPSPGTPDSTGSFEKKALLNNERNVNSQSGLSNDSKIKFHQNELDRQGVTFKSKSEQVEKPTIPPKHSNQMKSNNKSKPDSNTSRNVRAENIRADMFATPQQSRKSPSPPVQNGRGPWLTPQPQRKFQNTSESRPVMERQSSMPVNKANPVSYFEQQLESHRQAVHDSQPQSLPIEVNYTSEKPPLPRPNTANRVPARQKSQEGSRSVSASYDSAIKERQPENGSRTLADMEGRTPRSERRNYENEAVRKVSDREQLERSRSVERDKSQDYRRSMRVRNERPLSYHPTMDKNYYDFEDQQRFERSSKYATIRTPAVNEHLNENTLQYVPRHYTDHQYSTVNANHIHQARSRAPIPYNPYKYRETEMEYPRYQPHLHSANFLSKLALHEKEYLNRKMKSQVLKESSV